LTSLTIFGPVNETGVNLTELGGDTENLLMGVGGVVTCVASSTLSASAVCDGPNLVVTIFNGDPNFEIIADSVTFFPSVGTGIYTVYGPITATNLVVNELGASPESVPLGNFNCFVSTTLTATAT
ncbi:MAG TPA: hypothetical protein PLZ51_15475, partial [Aggregatilineales bacterium]|nr:hypothetical protein [Aggregatilineales bacterium]